MKSRRIVLMILAFIYLLNAPVHAAELYADHPLLSAPNRQAKSIGSGVKGNVQVIERKGFWVKIQSGEVTGWIRLSNVRMDEIDWMPPIDSLHDTGRMGHREN